MNGMSLIGIKIELIGGEMRRAPSPALHCKGLAKGRDELVQGLIRVFLPLHASLHPRIRTCMCQYHPCLNVRN